MNENALKVRRFFESAQEISLNALVEHKRAKSSEEAGLIVEADFEAALTAKTRYKSIADVYKRFVISLRNRNMMPGVIGSHVEYLGEALAKFEPRGIVKRYGQDYRSLLKAMLDAKVLAGKRKPKRRFLWRIFARGCLQGARFLSRFNDEKEFFKYVDKWRADVDTVCAFPLFLSKVGIPGLGPALAADFLKEVGVVELAKPDVHIIRLLTQSEMLAEKSPTELQVLHFFQDASDIMGKEKYPPVVLDKILWHLGSGKFGKFDWKKTLPGGKKRRAELRRIMSKH